MTKILMVEDEDSIRKFVKINLEQAGYEVLEAPTGEIGLEIAKKEVPEIVLLDIMLPGIDGFEVCKILRSKYQGMGIIMLTAKNQDIDRINGLESGCDDYVSKPFNPKELVLRVKSLERRIESNSISHDEAPIFLGRFKLDKLSRKIYKNDIELDLTPTEYSVLKLFLEKPNIAFSRDQILDEVWGLDFVGDSKIVDVNIRRLRAKIETEPSKPENLKTVWGVGYIWEIADE